MTARTATATLLIAFIGMLTAACGGGGSSMAPPPAADDSTAMQDDDGSAEIGSPATDDDGLAGNVDNPDANPVMVDGAALVWNEGDWDEEDWQ